MKTKVQGKVLIRKLTTSDISAINADYLDGENLVKSGYYKVWVESDPSMYVYMKTFGGMDPDHDPNFDLTPYAYIDHCGFLGDHLHIDVASIQNDEHFNKPRRISVKFVEDVCGENAKIFQSIDSVGRYYKRISSYPREHFARWVAAYKRQSGWEDGANIRPNVTFEMDDAKETVRASNWNGSAVYSDHFDIRFEGLDTCDKCGKVLFLNAAFYSDDESSKYHKLCKECYQQEIEFAEIEAEKKRREKALSYLVKMRFFESPNFSMTSDGEEQVLAQTASKEMAVMFIEKYALEVLQSYCERSTTSIADLTKDSGFSVEYDEKDNFICTICYEKFTVCSFKIERVCPNCGCNPNDEPYCMEPTHCPQCGYSF